MLTTDQLPSEQALSPRAIKQLHHTSRWVRFFGLLGFIYSCFGLIGAFGAISTILELDEQISIVWLLLGIALIMALVVAGFYISFILFDYGTKTSKFAKTADYEQLAKSFERQLTYWRWVGILMTVILAFYLLYFVFLIALGANAGL